MQTSGHSLLPNDHDSCVKSLLRHPPLEKKEKDHVCWASFGQHVGDDHSLPIQAEGRCSCSATLHLSSSRTSTSPAHSQFSSIGEEHSQSLVLPAAVQEGDTDEER